MPTYEYQCRTCSHRFETWQKMADEPLTICPECGGHIRRLLFPAGIVFKGSGFYKTDHGSSNHAVNSENGHAHTGEEKGEKSETAGETKAAGESKSGESKSSERKASESGSGGSGSNAASTKTSEHTVTTGTK